MANSKYDRSCSICGKIYEYCPNCDRYKHMERWHDAYCSENCKDLYSVTAGYINGWLDKEIESARLAELDLSYADKLPQWMKDVITQLQDINATDEKPVSQVLAEDTKEGKDEQTDEAVETKSTKPQKDYPEINPNNRYKANKSKRQ